MEQSDFSDDISGEDEHIEISLDCIWFGLVQNLKVLP